MGFIQEFKEFASKGSVVDLAVGVIIGGAFGKIVTSAVEDVIMPPIGMIIGKVDFTNLFIPLAGQTEKTLSEAKKAGPVLAYGSLVNNVIQFLILAVAIFIMVKAINKMKRDAPPAPPAAPAEDVVLLTEIRDLLKK
jgi:large conductance mechanosensitive channel